MNIHEYQAKQVLKSFGAPIADGVPITSAAEAEAAVKKLPGPVWVVKSQIHAGGRGKGKFKELGPDAKGGVRLAKTAADVVTNAKEMLGNTLVTKQTGPSGKQVNRLYIEDGADIARELYCSLLVDRTSGGVAFVVSTEGGMDIEAVAHDTPQKIITVQVDPSAGVTAANIAALVAALKLDGDAAKDAGAVFPALYKAFVEKDMSLLEVNPLIVMNDGHLRVLDAKMSFDNNAMFRHPELDAAHSERAIGAGPADLSRRGRAQVLRWLELLKGVEVASIYSSPQPQCHGPARAIGEAHQREAAAEPLLRDQEMGRWQGRTWTDVMRDEDSAVRTFFSEFGDAKAPGG